MTRWTLALVALAGPALAQQATPQPATTQPATPPAPVAAQQVSTTPALPGIDRPRQKTQAQEGVGKGAPVNGVLVLYGNERCPTNAEGDEIVVCERRSPEEQFRLPKEVRDLTVTPQNESWAAGAAGVMATGSSGIGTCTASGAGGATGCMNQRDQSFRAVKAAREKAERQGQ